MTVNIVYLNLKMNIKKIIIVNLSLIIIFLLSLEILARIYVGIKRGDSTAGLMERNLNLEYQPFVMFGPDWANVYKEFKDNTEADVELRVLLTGGSTAKNFPEEILEQKLTKLTNKKVKVYNSGYGGYNSTQELILITRFSILIEPDIIVNLNTANDILHSIREGNQPQTFFLNNTYETLIKKPYFGLFVYSLQHSQLFNGLVRFGARNKIYNIKDYDKYVDALSQNIKNMNYYSDGANILYLNVMQPHVAFKNIKHINESSFTTYKYREEIIKSLYESVYEKIQKNSGHFLDSRFIFNNNPSHIFSDDVHFENSVGYDLLGSAISEKVTSILITNNRLN